MGSSFKALIIIARWAPRGPMAGHLPSTTGRGTSCRRGVGLGWPWPTLGHDQLALVEVRCTRMVAPGEVVTGHLGEQIFLFPFPSAIKALCSPCQLSSAGLAVTSRSQGFGGLKLHSRKFLGCLHALSSLIINASVTVSVMCSFQCCVHTVSCLILTPCQPWMSPIH